ncbi:MAG: MerR family transcriptional regulator [Candidatus Dormiibacterota bacterium]
MPSVHAELGGRRNAGVNVQTLRYYERRGILPEPERLDSGYRAYGADAVSIVRFVGRARQLGFSLEEIDSLLDLAAGGPRNCEAARRSEAPRRSRRYQVRTAGRCWTVQSSRWARVVCSPRRRRRLSGLARHECGGHVAGYLGGHFAPAETDVGQSRAAPAVHGLDFRPSPVGRTVNLVRRSALSRQHHYCVGSSRGSPSRKGTL